MTWPEKKVKTNTEDKSNWITGWQIMRTKPEKAMPNESPHNSAYIWISVSVYISHLLTRLKRKRKKKEHRFHMRIPENRCEILQYWRFASLTAKIMIHDEVQRGSWLLVGAWGHGYTAGLSTKCRQCAVQRSLIKYELALIWQPQCVCLIENGPIQITHEAVSGNHSTRLVLSYIKCQQHHSLAPQLHS